MSGNRCGWSGRSRIVHEVNEISLIAVHPSVISLFVFPVVSHTGQLGGSNGLAFFRCGVGIIYGIGRASSLALCRTADHLRSSQLKDFGKTEERKSVDAQIKRLY